MILADYLVLDMTALTMLRGVRDGFCNLVKLLWIQLQQCRQLELDC